MIPSKEPKRDITDASDEQLFDIMAKNDSNGDASRAWAEFFKRYKEYLWKCCLQNCKSIPEGDQVAKDLFQTTMQKIFAKSKTYKKGKSQGLKGWISKIAFNEFQDYLKKYHLKFTNDLPVDLIDEEIDEEHELESDNIQTIKFENLKILLSNLSVREYKILITYMSYHQLDKPESHLPDEVMGELCEEFKVLPANVRQIKRRALLKLKNHASQIR